MAGHGLVPAAAPWGWSPLWAAALLLVFGCAPAGGSPPAPGAGDSAAGRAGSVKTITLGVLAPIKVYGHMEYPAGGGASLTEIHSTSLVTNSRDGGMEARLATAVPSFDAGTMRVLEDGRLETTWRLRTNAKWHDGAPFDAKDVMLGWRVHLAIPGQEGRVAKQVATMEAPDPLTLVITYKTTFFHALDLSVRELWPYPAHLLAEPFAGEPEAFVNHPYWTAEYVHLGPFRLVDYGLGENQIFERFDDYFLGRPKVDRVVIRTIPDTNTLFANLRAGSIDLAPEKTLPTDLVLQLRDEWTQTGAGTVYLRPENWRYAMVQLNPDWGKPPELSRDPRLRRGLYRGLDRVGLRAFALPGIPDTEADSFMPKNDPRAPTVGQPFARYPYDPAQALRELADAGWARAADGRMLNRALEPVQLSVRASAIDTKEVSVIADNWRQLGIEVVEDGYPPARAQDREFRAKFPALEIQSRGAGDDVLDNFYSPNRPTPESRYAGSNPTSYSNPAFDRLYEQLSATIDQREQGSIIREMGEILATDVPVLPTYFRVQMAIVTKGIQALADDYPGTTLARGLARNAHLWDRA